MADFKTVFTKDAAFRKLPVPPRATSRIETDHFNSSRTLRTCPSPFYSSISSLTNSPPKSQAIATPTTIYCSGQIPCTSSGEILTQPTSSISQMTELCIQNLSAVLKEAGSSIEKVVKVNVFLTTMDNFAEMNGTYEKWFKHKPARSCVAVYQLPKGVPVEIECVALA
jgi:2-iminobutanoate/2-iminopropanoate deaminase